MWTMLAAVVVLTAAFGVPGPAAADPADVAPLAGPIEAAPWPDAYALGDSLLSGMDSREHGGYSVDPATGAVTAFVVRGPRAASHMDAIRQSASRPGATGRFRVATAPVEHSLAELQRIQDIDVWQLSAGELGGAVVSAQIDTKANRVVVTTTNVSNELRRTLKRHFGTAVAVRPGAIPRSFSSRYDDPAPHYGGDRILFSYGPGYAAPGQCTTAYSATYRTTEVAVTAGHCAPISEPGWSPPFAPPYVVTNGAGAGEDLCTTAPSCQRQAFGTVWRTGFKVYRSTPEADAAVPSLDIALIPTQTAPTAYTAGSATAHSNLVSFPGAAKNIAGAAVCQSGATSQGRCSFTVGSAKHPQLVSVETNYRTEPLYAKIEVWDAVRNNTSALSCAGDSGGLIYQAFGSGLSILGSLSTELGGSVGTINGRPCTAGFTFTYWGQAAAYYPGFLPIIAPS